AGDDAPEVTSSEGNLVEVTAETGVDSLAGGGTEILFVMVDLAPRGVQIAAGCDLALLVDVSGSVLYGDMNSAVRSTAEIYAQQGGGNRTWLIAFGSEAQLLVDGLKRVPGRAEIERLLRGSKEAGGGTRLGPGIRLAVEHLSKSAASGARHVVVVSDGELGDSLEASQQAESAWKSDGISFSAILVGNSVHGGAALKGIAENCNGQFVQAQGMAAAGQLLRKEANLARSIVLRDLRLQAQLAEGVTLRRAFLVDPTREVVTTGNSQEVVKLGDLHQGEKRRVLLELQVKPGVGRERALGWLSLLSKGADAKERSPQVLAQVRVLNGTKKPTVNPAVDQCVTLVYRMVTRR
ncbi:MAG: VWA domain-containing protein, partial [Candidatus Eremiobacteraeota bacterium]|nr:VWA domain-containing protein [Candidatus Eremiobacteraeota bacterium]